MTTAMMRVRNNVTLYKRLLKMFLENTKFAELESALDANDLPAAADAAHAIKGVVGNLAFEPLFPLSTELMNQLRNGERNEQTLELYRKALIGTIEEVKEYLNSQS